VSMCTEGMREALGLSRDVSQCADGYVKLERSLMSGLPNEVDFAVNVFLLLSSEGRYTLKGVRGTCVVDCMLSCVGISRGQCPLFTALHAMQTRYCDENSLRPFVRPSHACIVTKR